MSLKGPLDRRRFFQSVIKAAAVGAVAGLGQAIVRGQGVPGAPRNVRIGSSVLQPTDFTCLGAFRPPSTLDFGAGLALRRVGGSVRLYSSDYDGFLIEYAPPIDSLLKTAPGFTQVGPTANFGDIFQSALYSSVDKGYGTPPFTGLADGLRPGGLYWDPVDQRMYWCYTSGYNSSYGVSDTCVGYSTLDDSRHAGTGIGMWKLLPPAPGGDGNRWVNGLVGIPPAFATAYCGGRRLGIGFGGFYSVCSNGPVSAGPALFAINPPNTAIDNNRNYVTTGLTKLLLHKWAASEGPGTHRARRHPALACYDDYSGDGQFQGRTDIWSWSDTCCAGVWIDTGTKRGFIVFPHLAAGSLQTTILASPAPTATSFAVGNTGDLGATDYIRVTTSYSPDAHYPFEMVVITGINGNVISHSGTTGTPIIGGAVFAGTWYAGGGNCATRYRTPWYIYDPADLAQVASGSLAPDLVVPASFADYAFPSADRRGGNASSPRRCRPGGAAYDPTAARLYVFCQNAWAESVNTSPPLVYVFSVAS